MLTVSEYTVYLQWSIKNCFEIWVKKEECKSLVYHVHNKVSEEYMWLYN